MASVLAMTLPLAKVCTRCCAAKPLEAFREHPSGLHRRRSQCRLCERALANEVHAADPDKHRNRTIKHRYGIDHQQYLDMVAEQDGRCAICRTDEGEANGKGQRYWLHIDHDHESGKIRGLLCTTCNTGIAHLRHNPLLLHQALRYLGEGDDLSR